eukprot:TRINITY_DN1910_c0_g1_i1.p1 TRINITY_DN1910_c0_g1~~TRINITY_DN1910_c0_g1_i1.p1  ORF type:complete len:484 (-),score=115.03 TRINITY_DN1910_c0_g1_i1:76-1527(-)
MSSNASSRSPALPNPVLHPPPPAASEAPKPSDDETIRLLEAEHQQHTTKAISPASSESTPLLAGKDGSSRTLIEAADEEPQSKFGVIIALIALIGCRTVDQVLYYRLARMYASYTWALGAIILSAGYLIVLWPVVWYKMYVSGEITAEHRRFPQKALFIMAIFDTLSNVIGTWPLPYIPSSITNVLSNCVLPMTMLCSVLLLRTGYKWTHYVGAVMVVAGIMVRLIPTFSGGAEKEPLILPAVWIPMYLISLIPSALSNVYKEGGLKGIKSDIWHVNAWIGVWQLILGFITMPTVFIPWPDTDIIKPSELGSYLSDASTCFFLGKNPRPGSPDECKGIFFLFVLYLAFNVAFNQLMLVVFKKGSSVLAVISSTARLPLVDILLLWGFLAGAAKIQSITIYDILALIIIISGIVTYKWHSEQKRGVDPNAPREHGIGSRNASPAVVVPVSEQQGKPKPRKVWTPSFMSNRGMALGSSPAFPKRF